MKGLNSTTIIAATVAAVFILGAFAANAGERRGPPGSSSSSSAAALGVGIGVGGGGGGASASASSDAGTDIYIPGNAAPGLSNVWRCSQSTSVGLGPLAYGWTDDHELCTLVFHKDTVCNDAIRFRDPVLVDQCQKLAREVAAYRTDTVRAESVVRTDDGDFGTMSVQPLECTLAGRNC